MGQLGRGIRVSILSLAAATLIAQNIISTVAGAPWHYPQQSLPATSAPLGNLSSLAFTPNGDLLVADVQNQIVIRISSSGIARVAAGNGISGFVVDGGPATAASLGNPAGVIADTKGNIYIADTGGTLTTTGTNNPAAIRKVALDGTITSLGVGEIVPTGPMAVDSAGNLFIVHRSSRVFRLQSDGTFVAVAGTGAYCFGCAAPPDGTAGLSAAFGDITGIAGDPSGNLYLADTQAGRIYKLSNAGVLSTLVTGIDAFQMACDSNGNLYVPDRDNSNSIKKISPSGAITLIAGNGTRVYSGDGGPASTAGLATDLAIAVSSAGTVYVADGTYVRMFKPGGIISVFAGNGHYHFGGDGGAASNAAFYGAGAMTIDAAGNIYAGGHGRIRRITPTRIVTTIAGTGTPGFSGDGGLAINARIGSPTAMATEAGGNLYFADQAESYEGLPFLGVDSAPHFRKIAPNGIITSLNYTLPGYPLNGMAVDPAGNLYISDSCNSVYRVTPTGTASLFAGTPCLGSTPNSANAGYNGDNIPAAQAMLNSPTGLASDAAGNIYIADTLNSRVRYVSPAGVIYTGVTLSRPSLLAVTPSGALFASTSLNSNTSISMISNGTVVPWAGNQGSDANAPAGDGGPAIAASINPNGIVVDSSGNLFVSELNDIREIFANTPAWTVTPSAMSFEATVGSASPSPQFITLKSPAGMAWSASPATIDGASWLTISSNTGTGQAIVQIGVNLKGLPAGTYTGTITFNSPADPVRWAVDVSLVVRPATPPRFYSENFAAGFAFSATQGSPSGQHYGAQIANVGGGTLVCVFTATTNSGGNWLVVPAGTISVPAETSLNASISVSTAGLPIGTYTGSLTLKTSLQTTLTATVTLKITAGSPVLAVSQKALVFTGVAGGGNPPAQSFAVLNNGPGQLPWTAAAGALYQPSMPLSISPAAGISGGSGTAAPQIQVIPDISGLAPGNYSANVSVTSAGPNDPAQQVYAMEQTVPVYLTVLSAGSALSAVVRPTGLVFAPTAASLPSAQQITVSNPGGQTLSFSATASNGVFTPSPTGGSIPPGQSTIITVQSILSASGTVQGSLTIVFGDGSIKTVALLGVVASGAPGSGLNTVLRPRDSTECVPMKFAGVFTSLSNYDFVAPAQTTDVRVRIVDDCGNPMNAGYTSVVFSDGSTPLPLNNIGSGDWEASWNVSQTGGLIRLSIQTNSLAGIANEATRLNVEVSSAAGVTTPFVYPGGVASAAYALPGTPVAPGGLIAIYGSGLAPGNVLAPSTPLPFSLGGVQVSLGSELLPLFYVGAGQINAAIPLDALVGATLPLTVTRSGMVSPFEPVVIAQSQPAIFIEPQVTPTQGAIVGPGGGRWSSGACIPGRRDCHLLRWSWGSAALSGSGRRGSRY